MPYKNPQELIVGLAQLPIAIEAALPEGAPKLSQFIIDASARGPVFPDFPVEIPDLPAVPEIPAFPAPITGAALGRRFVTEVEVRPTPSPEPAVLRQPLGKEIMS